MAANFKLSWFAPRKCWKKFRDGQMYYLGKGKCKEKYDKEGYQAALTEWEQIEAKLNTAKNPPDLRTDEDKRIDKWWEDRPERGLCAIFSGASTDYCSRSILRQTIR